MRNFCGENSSSCIAFKYAVNINDVFTVRNVNYFMKWITLSLPLPPKIQVGTYNLRFEWWFYFEFLQVVPMDIPEE